MVVSCLLIFLVFYVYCTGWGILMRQAQKEMPSPKGQGTADKKEHISYWHLVKTGVKSLCFFTFMAVLVLANALVLQVFFAFFERITGHPLPEQLKRWITYIELGVMCFVCIVGWVMHMTHLGVIIVKVINDFRREVKVILDHQESHRAIREEHPYGESKQLPRMSVRKNNKRKG
jgi:hypothetical protein